ncbi:MAG TPA: metalloregulator ArsR/SmtB family transcription factor [Verrucomicrobiales bacterium]|nr:metalloregulator ArsR/SmtB family transcription factor [Verrucomicrobiales bacterium]
MAFLLWRAAPHPAFVPLASGLNKQEQEVGHAVVQRSGARTHPVSGNGQRGEEDRQSGEARGKRKSPLDPTRMIATMIAVMTNIVRFSRALADETRWRILRLAMDEALCVCELADILEMPQSSVSSHVQIIRRAGLLEDEKCEKWTYFRVAGPHLPLLRRIAQAFADPDFYPGDAERTARRLSERENSCCPGPKRLAGRRMIRAGIPS